MSTSSLLDDRTLKTFAERAPGYDASNQFFAEDVADLKKAGYLVAPVPKELGGSAATSNAGASNNGGSPTTHPRSVRCYCSGERFGRPDAYSYGTRHIGSSRPSRRRGSAASFGGRVDHVATVALRPHIRPRGSRSGRCVDQRNVAAEGDDRVVDQGVLPVRVLGPGPRQIRSSVPKPATTEGSHSRAIREILLVS
jgi:hypothetical protein